MTDDDTIRRAFDEATAGLDLSGLYADVRSYTPGQVRAAFRAIGALLESYAASAALMSMLMAELSARLQSTAAAIKEAKHGE